MFFNYLFKNKKGNSKNIKDGIFNIAVIINIVCLSCSLLLLLGCFFVKVEKIDSLILISILSVAGCYFVEVLLAWASAMLENKTVIIEKEPVKKLKTTKKKEK